MNMSTTLSFDTFNDSLPPFDAEAEESILGGILLDESAIHRIKDRLKPEHFYFNSHKTIYTACLKLVEKGSSTQLPFVESYLKDNDLLAKIGGINKIRSLLYNTISAVNIDGLSDLVIDKAIRRAVIKVGGEIALLGYSVNNDLSDIIAALEKQTRSIIETPSYQTQEEAQRARHDRLLKDLTEIYTTCGEPSYRFYKMKDLAKQYEVSIKFLETLYLKSLASQCSDLLTYEELKEMAGGHVREWLLNGLIPKKTTICLVADGGIGKTKYAYSIAKNLIEGKALGIFQPTGTKRKILYYQGDEPHVDMYQALETLGYSQGDIGTYVKVRLGWSFENMPALHRDLQEFKPDFTVIDSLSSANRLSSFREGEMEYARPLLELAGLASKHDCTFLVIHHTNKGGDVRGTTAIRNSVSEFWKLSKPTDPTSTENDRLLEINKSRSRSSGKKYRLFFDSDNLSFTFLGEEGTEHSNIEGSLREQILQFFDRNRNNKFTAAEVSYELDSDRNSTRVRLSELKSDGLLSAIQTVGQANLYFLDFEGDRPGVYNATADVHPPYTPNNPDPVRVLEKFEGGVQENSEKINLGCTPPKSKNMEGAVHPPRILEETNHSKGYEGIQGGVQPDGFCPPLEEVKVSADTSAENERSNAAARETTEQTTSQSIPQRENLCPRTGLPLPRPFEMKVDSPIGISTAAVTFLKVQKDNRIAFRIAFSFANGTTSNKTGSISKGKAEVEQYITKEIRDRMTAAVKHPSRRYKVMQLLGTIQDPEVRWVEGCKCIEVPEAPLSDWWVFQAPDCEIIRVAGENEFKLET